MSAALLRRPAWVFDLDGTLTLATHDFEQIRVELGLPPGRPILEQLALLEPARRAEVARELERIELEHARDARPAPGAAELLAHLAPRARLGILTRNTRRNALVTLEATGLLAHFDPEHVLGRDEAPPKPDPGGVLHLLGRWGRGAHEAVMVGDFRFDLEAGRAAGAAVVYCDPTGAFEFAHLADHCVAGLAELLVS